VDANDDTLHYVYDERWRIVGVYENDDAAGDPIEQFAPHNAGEDGFGGSSYIDDVIMRDRDTDGDGAVDDERVYYCQNWRHDVVAVIFSDGSMAEWDAYSAYGVPFGLPRGDANSDGTITLTDVGQIQTWINGSTYDVRGDVDLDGDVDLTDKSAVQGTSTTLGRGNLSDIDNVLGYAGYVFDQRMTNKWHVRYRVLDSELGRWVQRDPLDYMDGMNLYSFVASNPIRFHDPTGRDIWIEGGAPNDVPFHLRLCIGDPNGVYWCYSFALQWPPSVHWHGCIPCPAGYWYPDPNRGGGVEPGYYLETPANIDAFFKWYFDLISNPVNPVVGPYFVIIGNCRDYCKSEFVGIRDMCVAFGWAKPPPPPQPASLPDWWFGPQNKEPPWRPSRWS